MEWLAGSSQREELKLVTIRARLRNRRDEDQLYPIIEIHI